MYHHAQRDFLEYNHISSEDSAYLLNHSSMSPGDCVLVLVCLTLNVPNVLLSIFVLKSKSNIKTKLFLNLPDQSQLKSHSRNLMDHADTLH